MSHASQRDCSISWHRSRLLSNRLSRLTIHFHCQCRQTGLLCKPVHVFLLSESRVPQGLSAPSLHGQLRQVKRATIAEMRNVVTYAVVTLVKSCEKKTREWVPMGLGALPVTSNLHRHMA